ncbi:MAG: hypothetical protein AAGK32_04220 [Actinomycetota bacterium]
MRDEEFRELLRQGVDEEDPTPEFVDSVLAQIDDEPAHATGDLAMDGDLPEAGLGAPAADGRRPGSARWWIRGGLAVAAAALVVLGIVVTGDGEDTTRLATEGGDRATDPDPSSTAPAPTADASPDLGTGDVQVTVRWAGPGDLNLAVVEPSGQLIRWGTSDGATQTSPTGGQIVDNDYGRCGEPEEAPHVENVFWPEGGAPAGEYRAWVESTFTCGGAVDYTIEVRVMGELVASDAGEIVALETSPPITFEAP